LGNEPDGAGNKVVVFCTVHGVDMLLAIAAIGYVFIQAAGTDFAPAGILLLGTARAFSFFKGSAVRTVQSASGNKLCLHNLFGISYWAKLGTACDNPMSAL